jgi:tetratricopeptide (TPR) repeat protein
MEREKALFQLKRMMGSCYTKADYQGALTYAEELERKVKDFLGEDNAVYASCLNNIALFQKNLGQHDNAMDNYTKALHCYFDTVGKKHTSYAATLANLGALYKIMAEKTSGLDKLALLDRAEEALGDSLELRKEISGPTHKETLTAMSHFASVLRVRGRNEEAESQYREVLTLCKETLGGLDLLTATVHNDFGFHLKSTGHYGEAKTHYDEALDIRKSLLGETHPHVIMSMNNIAELLIADGKDAEAAVIQQQIIDMVEGQANNEHDKADSIDDSVKGSGDDEVTSAGGIKITKTTNTVMTTKEKEYISSAATPEQKEAQFFSQPPKSRKKSSRASRAAPHVVEESEEEKQAAIAAKAKAERVRMRRVAGDEHVGGDDSVPSSRPAFIEKLEREEEARIRGKFEGSKKPT